MVSSFVLFLTLENNGDFPVTFFLISAEDHFDQDFLAEVPEARWQKPLVIWVGFRLGWFRLQNESIYQLAWFSDSFFVEIVGQHPVPAFYYL